jgi:hypothetical protein
MTTGIDRPDPLDQADDDIGDPAITDLGPMGGLTVKDVDQATTDPRMASMASEAPGRGDVASTASMARDGGRWRVQVGTAPATIRILTAAIDARVIPDTYVTDGSPVVIEAVSGAAGPVAGDEDAPLPLSVTPLRPPLVAALLAEHAEVVRVHGNAPSTTKEAEARDQHGGRSRRSLMLRTTTHSTQAGRDLHTPSGYPS